MSKKRVNIIGAGYSGISSACYLAKQGFDVHIYEKNSTIGGRSRVFEEAGFTFDMGPSWYWMPDVFENFFKDFGKKPSDYYQLKRLDPSYKVFFSDGTSVNLPANLQELYEVFESIEKGSADKLKEFLNDAAYKYDVGINDLVQKPSKSLTEFMRWDVIKGAVKLQLFKSFSSFARKYFKNPKLLQIIEFPVLF